MLFNRRSFLKLAASAIAAAAFSIPVCSQAKCALISRIVFLGVSTKCRSLTNIVETWRAEPGVVLSIYDVEEIRDAFLKREQAPRGMRLDSRSVWLSPDGREVKLGILYREGVS